MSIKGQSFTGAFSGGAHMDFSVGTAGLDTVFASDYTVAVLGKTSNSGWGLFGAYTDTTAATPIRQFFFANNSGGRLFGDGDFSAGFPDPANDADGITDNVWRWHVMSKATGSAHYKFSYADLSTLTWIDGESASAANHSDNATVAGMFSTWAIYAMGFDTGDIAAICVWPTQLTPTQIHSSCTKGAFNLKTTSTPIAGWLFPQATSGSTITDFMGGGANEISRPSIAVSADPPSFNFSLVNTVAIAPTTITLSTIVVNAIPQAVHLSLNPLTINASPISLIPVPGLVHVSLSPATIIFRSSLIGNISVINSFSVDYGVRTSVSKTFSLLFGVRLNVSDTVSLLYDIHMIIPQGKVFNLLYADRQVVSKSFDLKYGVRVPIASPKTASIVYGVRSLVTGGVSVQYNTGITGPTTVSKSFDVVYHTLVTPTVDKVITVPSKPDPVPPQIVTTSF